MAIAATEQQRIGHSRLPAVVRDRLETFEGKRAMNDFQKYLSTALLATAALLGGAAPAAAAVAPALGAASNFAVLSAAPNSAGAVTCTNSNITGDVGSSGSVTPTTCVITGSVIAPVPSQVVTDFNTAYGQYSAIPCTGTLNTAYTGAALTLTPGVYCNDAAVTFTDTTLTLDAQGNANAVWIFKIGVLGTGALTGTGLSVVMANGGQPCNVDWWVAQAATLTTSGFQGNILAGAAITLTGTAGTTTPFNGDVLAKAAVTLTDVTVAGCTAAGNQHHHHKHHRHPHEKCDQGVGNGPEDCDPGDSDHDEHSSQSPFGHHSNDEDGGVPGDPGRKGGNKK